MKIVTWNVNGIRACYKKNLMEFVQSNKPDILCLQETKAHIDQVEPEARMLEFSESHWSSAQRKGYSGVATFLRNPPKSVQLGMGIPEYDNEGRIVVTDHNDFVLFNIYFPNGGSGEERHQFKQKFLVRLSDHLQNLINAGREIIVVGDYNVAYLEFDVYDPVRLSKESGFLPEERQWFNQFLKMGFVDCFRYFNPDKKNEYSWWSYRELARISNRGWRIDHICMTKGLLPRLISCKILQDVQGSDHCPVEVVLK